MLNFRILIVCYFEQAQALYHKYFNLKLYILYENKTWVLKYTLCTTHCIYLSHIYEYFHSHGLSDQESNARHMTAIRIFQILCSTVSVYTIDVIEKLIVS